MSSFNSTIYVLSRVWPPTSASVVSAAAVAALRGGDRSPVAPPRLDSTCMLRTEGESISDDVFLLV
jgi:hypothetical protein